MEQSIEERVKHALEEARGYLQSHGGDVEFVGLDQDNVVTVRLTGACGGCPMATMTLKRGVEAYVKKEVPEVRAVEQAEE
jgi:Fe-S cluster biogenesis protein NfuA